MNIKHFITIPPIIAAAILANSAYGISIGDIGTGGGFETMEGFAKITCPSSTSTLPILPVQYVCATYGAKECYKSGSGSTSTTYVYSPCTSCSPGYTLTYVAISQCGLTNKIFKACDCICSNCTSDTTYTAAGTGYQKKINRQCECGSGTATCKTTTVYQCAVGYYGHSTNGTSGCTRCPSSGGVYGTTAAAGSTAITSCYIPSGSSFSDGTGSGTYTGNCYYQN